MYIRKAVFNGQKNKENSNQNNKIYCKFPYVTGLSYKIKNCFKLTNHNLVFYNTKTNILIYTKLKDKVPNEH